MESSLALEEISIDGLIEFLKKQKLLGIESLVAFVQIKENYGVNWLAASTDRFKTILKWIAGSVISAKLPD